EVAEHRPRPDPLRLAHAELPPHAPGTCRDCGIALLELEPERDREPLVGIHRPIPLHAHASAWRSNSLTATSLAWTAHQGLSYSSLRFHHQPVSLRPLGARSSH